MRYSTTFPASLDRTRPSLVATHAIAAAGRAGGRRRAAARRALQRRPDGRTASAWPRSHVLSDAPARPAAPAPGRQRALLVEAGNSSPRPPTTDRRFTPAAEWLLDNFYLIDEEVRTANRHLPRGYSRELPRLALDGQRLGAGLPRVYDLALQAIAHGDGKSARGPLSRFVAAYQSVAAAHARRVVGVPDHAAAGADREPAPGRGARAAAHDDADTAGVWADACSTSRRRSRAS